MDPQRRMMSKCLKTRVRGWLMANAPALGASIVEATRTPIAYSRSLPLPLPLPLPLLCKPAVSRPREAAALPSDLETLEG